MAERSARDRRFHRVGDGVEAGRGGDRRRLGERQLRIEDRDGEGELRVAARHLHVRPAVGDDRVALGLRARAGRGRHGEHRQERPARVSVAAVVGHRAAVRQQQVDRLGAIERAAAAEADDGVDAPPRRERHAAVDHGRVRVDVEVVEDGALHSGLPQQPERPVDVSRLLEAGVGDDQGPREAEVAGQFADAVDGAPSEHQARGEVEVEGRHRGTSACPHGLVGRLRGHDQKHRTSARVATCCIALLRRRRPGSGTARRVGRRSRRSYREPEGCRAEHRRPPRPLARRRDGRPLRRRRAGRRPERPSAVLRAALFSGPAG